MVTPLDPRLDFLLQVQADCREYGAIQPQRLQNSLVSPAVINEVWRGSDPIDVLTRLDKFEAAARLHRIWVERISAHLDAMASEVAESAWKALARWDLQAHHAFYQSLQALARASLRLNTPSTGLALVARYRVALAKAAEKLFAAYGRAMVARLPVACDIYRALDSRVYAGGSGASEGLVHIFPRADILLPGGARYPAGESLGRKKRFWNLVSDDGSTPIALDDLKIAERIIARCRRA